MKFFQSVYAGLFMLLFMPGAHAVGKILPSPPDKPTLPKEAAHSLQIKAPADLLKMPGRSAKQSAAMQLAQAWVVSYGKTYSEAKAKQQVMSLRKLGMAAFMQKASTGKYQVFIGPSVLKQKLVKNQAAALHLMKTKSKIIRWKLNWSK